MLLRLHRAWDPSLPLVDLSLALYLLRGPPLPSPPEQPSEQRELPQLASGKTTTLPSICLTEHICLLYFANLHRVAILYSTKSEPLLEESALHRVTQFAPLPSVIEEQLARCSEEAEDRAEAETGDVDQAQPFPTTAHVHPSGWAFTVGEGELTVWNPTEVSWSDLLFSLSPPFVAFVGWSVC